MVESTLLCAWLDAAAAPRPLYPTFLQRLLMVKAKISVTALNGARQLVVKVAPPHLTRWSFQGDSPLEVPFHSGSDQQRENTSSTLIMVLFQYSRCSTVPEKMVPAGLENKGGRDKCDMDLYLREALCEPRCAGVGAGRHHHYRV